MINAGRVISYIDSMWDTRASVIVRIKHALPELQERARYTNELAVKLLRQIEKRKHVYA
jgi:predicted ATPase